MEKGFEYWFHKQGSNCQLRNSNRVNCPFDLNATADPPYMNAFPDTVSPIGINGRNPPVFPTDQSRAAAGPHPPNEPRRWFYCLPRYRQTFAPVPNLVRKDTLPNSPNNDCKEAGASTQKRFLVFDQSGDQTTLIYSSGVGDAVPFLPPWNPKPPCGFDLNNDLNENDSVVKYEKEDDKSEMHEDTEELNALLYSDDDDDEIDCSEDEEETSTGHSPTTVNDGQESRENCGEEEEVASCVMPAKRQKLADGAYEVVPLLAHTASSDETDGNCVDYEDDAELSCCGNGVNQVSGNKRSRKDKIRETVNVLQKLIPGGSKQKDAIVVIDEAIQYLRSLKVKAKALGLDSL